MANKITIPTTIVLNEVRLSYPKLIKPEQFKKGEGEPAFSASFIMRKDQVANVERVRLTINNMLKELFGELSKVPKGIVIPLRAGDEGTHADKDGYGPDVLFISSRSVPTRGNRPPQLLDADSSIITDPSIFYAGCYVDCAVRLWYQDGTNGYGRKINAQLVAVKLLRKDASGAFNVGGQPYGDPFGEGAVDAAALFGGGSTPAASAPGNGQSLL